MPDKSAELVQGVLLCIVKSAGKIAGRNLHARLVQEKLSRFANLFGCSVHALSYLSHDLPLHKDCGCDRHLRVLWL